MACQKPALIDAPREVEAMTELVPFIQLGFAALMALALLWLVRGYMGSMLDQNAKLVQFVAESNTKIALTLENHLGAISVNQAKTAASLEQIQDKLLDALLEKNV